MAATKGKASIGIRKDFVYEPTSKKTSIGSASRSNSMTNKKSRNNYKKSRGQGTK